jgi:ABC-type multidrug transport system ATPase subunit
MSIRPSGSGKTSLLDVIAKRIRNKRASISGEVLFNGRKEGGAQRRRLMSYVTQEDSLMGILTVRETLWFAARFYYGYGIDIKPVKEQIEAIVDSMGLRSCADTIVGNIFMKGLSGGQKRRLSVGVELISSPAILLLDEPTSGLDSASAYAMIMELRSLAALGHTILCTIHQPSSEIWAQFDRCMLLAQGQVCYNGVATGAISHFAAIGYSCPPLFNPADFIINLVATDFDINLFKRPNSIQELAQAYDSSSLKGDELNRIKDLKSRGKATAAWDAEGAQVESPGKADNVNSPLIDDDDESRGNGCFDRYLNPGRGSAKFHDNLITLTYRNLLNLVRNPGIILVRLVMYTMLAVFVGIIYINLGRQFTTQSANARLALFFCTNIFYCVMCMAVIPFVEIELPLYMRERRNGAYKAAPYVLAHFFAMIPGTLLLVTISSLVIVYMAQLNGFFYFFIIFWASLLFSECYAYLLATICPHYIIAIAVGSGIYLAAAMSETDIP